MTNLLPILCLLLSACAQAAPPTVAIRNVAVVDVTDGSLHADQTVLVEGNRITAVGPADEVGVPDDADVIDAPRGYLIPGLLDMHTHLLWSTDANEHMWTEMPEDVNGWTLWERYYGPTPDLLELLVDAGLTPLQALQAATINPARFLNATTRSARWRRASWRTWSCWIRTRWRTSVTPAESGRWSSTATCWGERA